MSVRRYVLALAVLGGCGFPKPPPIEDLGDGDFAVELANPRIRVVEGASATVGVKLVRSGLTAPVAVTVTGLPTGVTADPLTVDADVGTLTLHATPDAVQGDAALTITATADGLSHNAALSLLTMGLPGTLDQSFGHGGMVVGPSASRGDALVIQPDGKIVVAGGIGTSGMKYAILRYSQNGDTDTSFSDGDGMQVLDSKSALPAIALQTDGKIVVAETIGSHGTQGVVVRLNSDGSRDNSFGNNSSVTVFLSVPMQGGIDALGAIAILPDDGILVGGIGSTLRDETTVDESAVVKLTAQGVLDTRFGTEGRDAPGTGVESAFVKQIIVAPDESLLIASISHSSNIPSMSIERLDSNGRHDSRFGFSGSIFGVGGGTNASMVLQPNGQILALTGSRTSSNLARIESTSGRPDTDFGTSGIRAIDPFAGFASPSSFVRQQDGKLIAVGAAYPSETSVPFVARLTPAAGLDTTFGGGIILLPAEPRSTTFSAVALDADGRIVATGYRGTTVISDNQQLIVCRFWP